MKRKSSRLLAMLLAGGLMLSSAATNISAASSILSGGGRYLPKSSSIIDTYFNSSSSSSSNYSSSYSYAGYVSPSGTTNLTIASRVYLTSDELYLYIPGGIVQGTVYVTGATSRSYSFSSAGSKYQTIDLSRLPYGYYSIRINAYSISTSGGSIYYHF